MSREHWRPIGCCPAYEVSDRGRVRRKDTGRLRILSVQDKGYVKVNLSRGSRGDVHQHYVHDLVCRAFHGDPPKDGRAYEVDHLNFDREDNWAENLRWLLKQHNAWRWQRSADEADPDQVAHVEALEAAAGIAP